MSDTYESLGKRPIEWVVEMDTRYSLFLEDPGTTDTIPIKLMRHGNSIKLLKAHEHITCRFLDENLDTEFIEFAEVPDANINGNSRIELRSPTTIAYVSIF